MNSEPASDPGTVESYLKLLLEFRALPEIKRRQTFMEVSGYPHYENVCSNILGFYFDPAAEHGLKDLLLLAFLQMAGAGEISIPEKVLPIREYPADDQQRIDLVIDCEAFTLGIENKISHWEANDFENYGRVIDRLGRNKKVIKAMLCLKYETNQSPPGGGFKRYTYGELWRQVGSLLHRYISNADTKWVTCLLDFMQTTTNLAGENMELKKTDQFFIEHNEDIERMFAERNAFLERLKRKIAQLVALMEKSAKASDLIYRTWVFEKSCLVLYFNSGELDQISFDLYLSPARPSDHRPGWELHLFGRNTESKNHLENLVNQPALNPRVTGDRVWGDRYLVARWCIEEDLGVIEVALRTWINAVIDANKEILKQ